MIFLPVQCRMARAALGLGIRELAAVAKVSIDTVVRFERGEELKERTVDALRGALEAAGIEFTNGDQPGVRLGKPVAASAHASKPAGTQPMPPGSSKGTSSKASDMAGVQIDKLGDPSATVEERKTRKRRLLKGPTEFRDMRV